jgi:hypothetical protein
MHRRMRFEDCYERFVGKGAGDVCGLEDNDILLVGLKNATRQTSARKADSHVEI